MSVKDQVLADLESRLGALADTFGEYMSQVVSEKSVQLDSEDEEVVEDEEEMDGEEDPC
jgi:hypothetical protein